MNSPGRLIPEVEYYHGSKYKLENRLLSTEDVKELGNALSTNSIRALSLQGVTLDNASFRRICSSIGICRSLCNLNLSDNVLSSPERVISLCECLNLNRGLTALFLQGTPLEQSSVAILSRAIKLHPTIRTLDLTNCSLNDTSLKHVTHLLPSEKGRDALEDLSIGSNPDISHNGWKHFSMAIADNSCLRSLQLYFNDIGDHAACLLIVAMSASKTIVSLDLENTNIGDQTAETLLQLMNDFPHHLRDINLSGNQISRGLLQKIKQSMSIHQSYQGATKQPKLTFEPSQPSDNGPSAPYYIPSHGVTNRPQTVPEDDEEQNSEFDETPREAADTIQARNQLRNQLQLRSASLDPAERDNSMPVLGLGSSGEIDTEQIQAEKPMSPPLTARRIGTAVPGSRRPAAPLVESTSNENNEEIDMLSPQQHQTSRVSSPPTNEPPTDSPYSDIIISQGAALLDDLEHKEEGPVIEELDRSEPSSSQSKRSNYNLTDAKLEKSKSGDQLLSNTSKQSPPLSREKNLSNEDALKQVKEETSKTYVKTPEKKQSLGDITPVNRGGSFEKSRKETSSESIVSRKSAPKLKTETIPRSDVKGPPDSSRLQVSKSLSFERSLQDRNQTKPKRSTTDGSIHTKNHQNNENMKPLSKENTVQRGDTDLSNAYPTINFGVKQHSQDSLKSKTSSVKENVYKHEAVFGVNSQIKDPRVDHLRAEGRKTSNVSSAPTIASSYGDAAPATENYHQILNDKNVEDNLNQDNLKDKNLGEVLRRSQVPVSNRMVDHGMNGEIEKNDRQLSEESIPRSLKSLLSRHSTAEQMGTEVLATDEFSENADNYLYANRNK